MILNSTTDSLEIVLDKSATTNQVSFCVHYIEYTSTGATPMSNYGVTNNTTAVNLISSPSSNTQRQLKYCSINNRDTDDIGVKIRLNNNGNFTNILNPFLKVKNSIQFTEELGWRVYNDYGYERTSGYQQIPPAIRIMDISRSNGVVFNAVAGTSYCHYLGRAERPFSSINVQYRGGGTGPFTWAEMAIYKGKPTLGSATTINLVNYVDTSSQFTGTTGNYIIPISTSGISIGDDLWVVYGFSGGTNFDIYCNSNLILANSSGYYMTITNTRPSLTNTMTPSLNTVDSIPIINWQGIYKGN